MNRTILATKPTQVITFFPAKQEPPIQKKVLILDSGTIINLAMNGLLYIIEELKKETGVRFCITEFVKKEVVDKPLTIPRFELEALRINDLIEKNIIEMPKDLQISSERINSKTAEFMETVNHSVKADGKWIRIVSEAEMSCLAFSNILSEMDIVNLIAIDERTTRTLSEKPESLEQIMSNKLHQKITVNLSHFLNFTKFRFIRSTEMVYVAFKKGLLGVSGDKALEAALYATKYKGSSVSFEEIDELKRM